MITDKLIMRKYLSKIVVRYTPTKNAFLEDFNNSWDMAKKIEYEMVKRGLRKAARLDVKCSEFATYTKNVANDEMVLLPIRLKQDSPEPFLRCALAREMDDAREMLSADMGGNIVKVGNLLGYPDCCTHFFNTIWKEEAQRGRTLGACFPKLFYESAVHSKHEIEKDGTVVVYGIPELNPFLHWFGMQLIPWSPCNFNCEKALEKSKVWLKVMKEELPMPYKFISNVLSKKMTWSINKGIAFTEHPCFYGIVCGEFDLIDKVKIRWEPR